MAGEAIVEELALDISPALDALGPLGTALDDLVSGFGTSFADAIASAVGQPIDTATLIDTAGISTAIDTAVSDAQPAPIDVPVDGDTTPLTAAIDDVQPAPIDVPVSADTSDAQAAIGDLSATSIEVPVVADTTDAQAAIEDLGASATGAVGSSGGGAGGGSGLAGLEGAAIGVRAASGAAQGEVGGLTEAVGGLSVGTGTAVAGLATFSAFVARAISQAADQQVQVRRFAQTFGDLADEVSHIDVGGLTISLDELGVKSGTTGEDLQAVATRIGLLGQSSGAAAPQIVQTTQNLLALGATVAVNNPRLGDAAEVTDRLANAFARGGRALAPFGISLSAAQINAEALKETGKATAAELTIFEKAAAGANLALGTFGGTLGTRFAEGASNAQVKFRALRTEITEALDTIGTPLLDPAVQSFEALVPVAIELGQVIGNVAGIVLPFVAALAPAAGAIAAPLALVADGLGLIATGVEALPEPALLGIAAGIIAIGVASGAADGVIVALGGALAVLEGPVGLVGGALAALGIFADAWSFKADDAATVTKDLGDVLFGEVKTVTDLSGAVADLNKNLTEFDTSTTGLAKDAPAVAAALKDTGITAAQLNAGIQGTAQQFDALKSGLQGTAPDLSRFGISVADLTGSQSRWLHVQSLIPVQFREQAQTYRDTAAQLDALRIAYEESVKQQLQFIQTSGALSKTDLDSLLAKAAAGTITYTEALKVGTAASAKFAEQQSQTAIHAASASGALGQLREQIILGTISATDAEAALVGLGISAEDAKQLIDPLATAIQSFVDTSTKALPGARNALDDYTKTVEDDFKKATDAQANHEKTAKGLFAELNKDSDPATFTANMLAEIAAIDHFQANIATLAKTAPELAQFFAEQGPAAAGGIAAGFASAPAKAKIAEGVLTAGTTAEDTYVNFLRTTFGPQVAAAAAEQSGLVSSAFAPSFVGKTTDAVAQAARTIAANAEAVKLRAGEMGEGGTAAYAEKLKRFPLATTEEIFKAQKVLDDAAKTLGVPAGSSGAAVAAAYAEKLDVKGVTGEAIDASQSAWDPQQTVNTANAARRAGILVGHQFDKGIAQGISAGQGDITTAATVAAAAAERAAKKQLGITSPSRVGIEIGEQFVAGIALGVANVAPIVSVSEDTAAALTASFAAAGTRALGGLVEGFNDRATIDAASKQLADALAAGIANAQQTATQTAAQQQLDQFVNAATSQLPNAQQAISLFSSTIATDLGVVNTALATSRRAHALYDKALAATTITRNKLAHDIAAGAPTKVIFLDQDALNKATVAANQARAALAAPDAALTRAQAALAKASSPDAFIRDITAQTARAQSFAADLKKIAGEGFDDLAEQLAIAGPTVAGKLADAFAGSASKAKLAEAAIDSANTLADNYQTTLETLFAPAALSTATAIGANIGAAIATSASTAIATTGIALAGPARPPVLAVAPAVAVSASSGSGPTFNFALDIALEDGTKRSANLTFTPTPAQLAGASRLVQKVVATVSAQ